MDLSSEELVRALLAEESLSAVEENPRLERGLRGNSTAIDLLLTTMRTSDSAEVRQRARDILHLLDCSDAAPIVASLESDDSLWRHEVLHLLWALGDTAEDNERQSFFRSVAPRLVFLLQDRQLVTPELSGDPELEFEFRVCDDTYMVLQLLRDEDFETDSFTSLDFDDRDKLIEVLVREFGSTGVV